MIRAKGQRLCLCLEAHEFLGEPGKSIRDGGETGPAYNPGFHSKAGAVPPVPPHGAPCKSADCALYPPGN